MDIRDFADKYIAAEQRAFQTGEFGALAALEGDDVVYHLGDIGDMVGLAAHREDIRRWRAAVPEMQQTHRYVTGDGGLFVLAVKEGGRIVAPHPVFPLPVGKVYAADVLFVGRVENGQLREAWGQGSVTFSD